MVGQFGYSLATALTSVLVNGLTQGGVTKKLADAGVPDSQIGSAWTSVNDYVRFGASEPATDAGRKALADAGNSYVTAFTMTLLIVGVIALVVAIITRDSRQGDAGRAGVRSRQHRPGGLSVTATTLDHDHTGHADCCAARAQATAAFAGTLAEQVRIPDVRDILSAKEPSAKRRRDRAETVDLLVLGSIATANPDQPTAEAMGISEGRIVAIGTRSELDGLTGEETQIVDGSDGVIIPGLIEPHMHLWSTGLFFDWEDCSQESNPTFDDVVARMKAAAAKAKPGEWICGQLFDPSLYPGEPELTAVILDQVSADTPVVVANASMHFMYVNSAAFKAAGITAETPDPPSGKFYRVDGKLTGCCRRGQRAPRHRSGHAPERSGGLRLSFAKHHERRC